MVKPGIGQGKTTRPTWSNKEEMSVEGVVYLDVRQSIFTQ